MKDVVVVNVLEDVDETIFDVMDVRKIDIDELVNPPEDDRYAGYLEVRLKGRTLIIDRNGVWDKADSVGSRGGEVDGEDPEPLFENAGYVAWEELLQLLDGMRHLKRMSNIN